MLTRYYLYAKNVRKIFADLYAIVTSIDEIRPSETRGKDSDSPY